MATLEKIRSRAGLLIFTLAFALLCFVVGDFLTNSTSLFRQRQNVIGSVFCAIDQVAVENLLGES
ncbi:MAG: SurA N-terminal domain-containing protein, partial [Paludibacteraceae bacterium]|nr:SurA N-terminal domain-containing protein [Paludibacteraceae bacterium]